MSVHCIALQLVSTAVLQSTPAMRQINAQRLKMPGRSPLCLLAYFPNLPIHCLVVAHKTTKSDLCSGVETEQMLAPRKQSLPVPHAPPAFIPAWAPTDPDMARHNSPTMSAPYRPVQAHSSGYMPEDSQHARSCHDAAVGSSAEPASSHGNSPAAMDDSALRRSAQGQAQGLAEPNCLSPGRESYQSLPAVNINITGACACMTPARRSASTGMQEQASAAEQHSSAKLNAEPSLAHLHQPANIAVQPAGSTHASPSCNALDHSNGGQGSVPQANGGQQADQGGNSGIDTAALQKEVTELRQQVSGTAENSCMAKAHHRFLCMTV